MSINSIAQNKKSFLRNGNELYADSSYNEAEIQYRKSLEKDQDYFNASFNLANAIYKQERYEESSALFDALKDNAPTETDLAKVYHNIGNSLVKEQKLDEAIEAYKSALRIKPKDKDTRHNLALTHQQKQQQEDKDGQEKDKEEKNKEEEKENNEQEQKQENKEQQEGKQENNPEEKKEEMSKETAEKMLDAIQQQEKELQKELQKKKVKDKRVKVLKDW
jgi:tetratricopeptide (TPR) repeat protein